MYKVNVEMLGEGASENDAEKMVSFLSKNGYDVEYTTDMGSINRNEDFDYIPEDVWETGLSMLRNDATLLCYGQNGFDSEYSVSGEYADGRKIIKTAYQYGNTNDKVLLRKNGKDVACASWNVEQKKYIKVEI